MGLRPETVAKVIETAITAKKPKIRYRVTPSAHLGIAQRRMMTAGMWDAALRTLSSSVAASSQVTVNQNPTGR